MRSCPCFGYIGLETLSFLPLNIGYWGLGQTSRSMDMCSAPLWFRSV